ncbi:hypothetical protein HV782_021765 [Pseudomonas monsensis]|uniref:hypothetical protein n=1 Tax=Pseudomonas monsensis TaxID=2745509 RepID=UPI0016454138|nr:hypothetical protein [Pseudomonas monsensis]QXH99161.1 hypothetical protein HV782_021765 [Pseudomonas monsensis]
MSQSIDYIFYGIQAQKDWSDWFIPIMSAVPAFIALWFTYRQNSLTKKHNRLMVKPHLDDLTHEDIHGFQYKYSIVNNGVGPAIIADVKVTIDGAVIDSKKDLPDIVRVLFPDIADEQFGHHSIAVGSYLSPGKDISVLTINCASKAILLEVKNGIRDRARLVINYESVYGDKLVFRSHPSEN